MPASVLTVPALIQPPLDAFDTRAFIPRPAPVHMFTNRQFYLSLLAAAALIAQGCVSHDPRYSDDTQYVGGFRGNQERDRAPHDDVSYWDGDGVPGQPEVVINLSEQRAYFYKSNELVGISTISTGREEYATPTGTYKITQKDRHHNSSAYGNYVDAQTGEVVVKDVDSRKDPRPPGTRYDGAPMPYFMRVTGGVGMHEGFLPGYAASHGCIRMPGFMAERFFSNVSVGTPVRIIN